MAEHQHDVRQKVTKPPSKVEKPSSPVSNINDPLKLQGLIGNQAMQRLLAKGHTTLPSGRRVQAKLTVTSADNAYEHEADSVAEQVVNRMASGEIQRAEDELQAQRARAVVQREEEEIQAQRLPNVVQRAEEEIQMKGEPASFAESFDVDTQVEDTIKGQQGKGQSMPAELQRSMEGAFGADFNNVRVHTDSVSDNLNKQVGARAFTTGADVFFGAGEYQPDTSDGKKLLAHELTHTIQQDAVGKKQ